MRAADGGRQLSMKLDVTGQGFPLVLVPGGLTGWLTFEPHAEHWSRERRVIRAQLLNVDLGLRGEPLPPEYSIELEAKALVRALDDLGVDEFDLFGWSHGGAVALNLALARPARVRTLTLAEPDAFWLLHRVGRYGEDAEELRRVMAACAGDDITGEQLATFMRDAGVVPTDVDPRSVERWPVWFEHRLSLRIGDTAFHHQEDIELLRSFQRPVLLFKGEGSPPHMTDTVDSIAAELPNARVVELPGAHVMLVESIDRFLAIVSQFLREAG